MTGLLDMNNSRIENVGPGRHGNADALTPVQFEAFYFDLNIWVTRSSSSQGRRNKILH